MSNQLNPSHTTESVLWPLKSALSEAVAQYLCFQQLLNDEKAALEQNDYETILSVSTAKQSRLNHIARYSEQVATQLKSLITTQAKVSQQPQNIAQLEALLSGLDVHLLERWQAYQQIMRTCQLVNRENHALLTTRKHFVEETLRFLTQQATEWFGQAKTSETPLYNAQGQRDHYQKSQELARI